MKKILQAIKVFFWTKAYWIKIVIEHTDTVIALRKDKDTQVDKWKSELYQLIAYLSDGTWKDGDSIAETIDDHQERKYMKIHREDVIVILTENQDPEDAASALLEYFEILDDNGVLKPKE
jgi:hypothetical protein